jgi:hypothetical protein
MSWCPTDRTLTTLTEAGVDCHVVNDAARALQQLRGAG